MKLLSRLALCPKPKLLQTYQGALDMLENVYIKTGGTGKCFSSDSSGHGSGKMIQLYQLSGGSLGCAAAAPL